MLSQSKNFANRSCGPHQACKPWRGSVRKAYPDDFREFESRKVAFVPWVNPSSNAALPWLIAISIKPLLPLKASTSPALTRP